MIIRQKRIVSPASVSSTIVSAVFLLMSARPAAAQTGTFSLTGSMSNARLVHSATLLTNGKVLVAGGFTPGVNTALASAELYDPNVGVFSAMGSMATPRRAHSAVLLANGKVLVVGGRRPPTYFASAELFDPASGRFSPTGGMSTPRAFFTATLLNNGKVLVAGGLNSGVVLASAEIYDPNTGVFSPTGSMSAIRESHTATLLPDGRVLIVGGDAGSATLATAELYDPDAGTFKPTGSMGVIRGNHTATLIPPSPSRPHVTVLVAGGFSLRAGGSAFTSAELYDGETGLFSPTGNMNTGRENHTAVLMPAFEVRPHGKVLVAGGDSGNLNTGLLASAEVYDPDTGRFSPTGSMTKANESKFDDAARRWTRSGNGRRHGHGHFRERRVICRAAHVHADRSWHIAGRNVQFGDLCGQQWPHYRHRSRCRRHAAFGDLVRVRRWAT